MLNSGVDLVSMPQVRIYLENLTRPWEPEETPYEYEEEEDDEAIEKEDE